MGVAQAGVGKGNLVRVGRPGSAGLEAPGKLWQKVARWVVHGHSAWVTTFLLVCPCHSAWKKTHVVRDSVDHGCAGRAGRGATAQGLSEEEAGPVCLRLLVGLWGCQ